MRERPMQPIAPQRIVRPAEQPSPETEGHSRNHALRRPMLKAAIV
jgi:hypothetical protein